MTNGKYGSLMTAIANDGLLQLTACPSTSGLFRLIMTIGHFDVLAS